jgi:hypothetical protein
MRRRPVLRGIEGKEEPFCRLKMAFATPGVFVYNIRLVKNGVKRDTRCESGV